MKMFVFCECSWENKNYLSHFLCSIVYSTNYNMSSIGIFFFHFKLWLCYKKKKLKEYICRKFRFIEYKLVEHTKCGRKYFYSFKNAFKHYTPCMQFFFFFKKTSFEIEEGRWILDLYITIVIYIIINSFCTCYTGEEILHSFLTFILNSQ